MRKYSSIFDVLTRTQNRAFNYIYVHRRRVSGTSIELSLNNSKVDAVDLMMITHADITSQRVRI